uniref:Odorant-binding protein 11 n=1 Tax=Dastarcus helophoroides TaxID=1169899 RepID=A0A1I9HZN9_9CUCU|nr:odorant-binding protein 11 [Dastarcus helophoroides]
MKFIVITLIISSYVYAEDEFVAEKLKKCAQENGVSHEDYEKMRTFVVVENDKAIKTMVCLYKNIGFMDPKGKLQQSGVIKIHVEKLSMSKKEADQLATKCIKEGQADSAEQAALLFWKCNLKEIKHMNKKPHS